MMPSSEKARRAAYAEIRQRKQGGKPRKFVDMPTEKLIEWASSEIHKKKKSQTREDW
jgi:hypothetical protein